MLLTDTFKLLATIVLMIISSEDEGIADAVISRDIVTVTVSLVVGITDSDGLEVVGTGDTLGPKVGAGFGTIDG